ncbi:Uncharacterised protein [uncultured archaeon]|nr:Uncharacterised protein [uncultured archaeon]
MGRTVPGFRKLLEGIVEKPLVFEDKDRAAFNSLMNRVRTVPGGFGVGRRQSGSSVKPEATITEVVVDVIRDRIYEDETIESLYSVSRILTTPCL